MDFSAIPRPAFGRHAQHAEDKAPAVHKAKAAARRAMMFKEARELLSALPRPGEAVHAIMTGALRSGRPAGGAAGPPRHVLPPAEDRHALL